MDIQPLKRPEREAERLAALRELFILDSEPEPVFDSIARLASEVCGAPIALISLVDEDRQWFKASVGGPGVSETPRDIAFCAHAILGDDVMEVRDATLDSRFADNPLVTGELGIRFYAGAPLMVEGGDRVGTLCVIDRQPRELSDFQLKTLRSLSEIAVQALTMRRELITRSLSVRSSYEQALAESEARHRALVEDQSELVSLSNEAGEFVYLNPAQARHFGSTVSKLIGTCWIDSVPPSERSAVRAVIDKVFETGETFSSENRVMAADGTEHWVSWSNTLQIDAQGRKLLHSVGRDISEHKRHELALAAASAELNDLYQNVPCGYHSLDSDGRYVRINDTELRWMGRNRDEVIGKKAADFLTPEGCELFSRCFPILVAEGHVENLEFDLVSATGVVRRVVANATVVRTADGDFSTTRTVTFDVTELQQLKEELRRLASEQLAMLDIDLIGILKFKDRVVRWVNPGAARLLGYSTGELVGQSTRLLYPDDAAYRKVGDDAYPLLNTARPYRAQMQLVRKDGSPRWFDFLTMALPTRPDEIMCMLVDITSQKQAEVTRLRTLMLESENRQLVESNRAKSAFLSNMSHELHTPLNAVLGYAHLLRAGSVAPDSPKFARYLDQIGSSGQQLLALIDGLLDFAKLESGKFDFHPEPLLLRALIDEVIDIHAVDIRRRGIVLEVEVDPALGEVVVDRMRLSQVVSQFVSNAIKFSHDAGRVGVSAAREGSGDFRITVEDFGIGVARDDLPRLFTAFRQLSEGHGKAFPGAGLGLALARRLIDAQGGSVGVDSQEGVGSTFHLVLPRRAHVGEDEFLTTQRVLQHAADLTASA